MRSHLGEKVPVIEMMKKKVIFSLVQIKVKLDLENNDDEKVAQMLKCDAKVQKKIEISQRKFQKNIKS